MSSLVIEFIFDFIGGTGSVINSIFNNLFYLVFYIEDQFKNYIDFTYIYKLIYSFAILLLVMFFIKKMIETYFFWSSGDPDTNPTTAIFGLVKAITIMICFGFLYDTFVSIMAELNSKLTISISQVDIVKIVESQNEGLFIVIANLVFILLLLSIIGQFIMRGIEILIMRLAIPFSCIGLLNSDGGIFPNFIKKFLQNAFTVIIQFSLINLSIVLMSHGQVIYAICCATIALRTPHMLQELMIASSGTGIGGVMKRIASTVMYRGVRKL